MRTTLKRGMGRATAANGNGRAVLPPAVVTPVTRYRQPPPPRRRLVHVVARFVVWLFVVVLTVAAGVVGGVYLYLEEGLAQDVRARTHDVKLAARTLDVAPAGKPAIALALGYDRRWGREARENGARSDTIMLLRADPTTDSISMLSLPRDLVVDIRCPGRAAYRDRINMAYSECGVRGTLETVRALTGLPINYLITVNFLGFTRLVASLGGVWMDVDRRYFNDNTGCCDRYSAIDLQPGYQKLNGKDALAFVRHRHTDSDLYRVARQQLFVHALRQAVTASFSPSSLRDIVDVVTDNVEVGAPGDAALDPGTLLSYGLFLYERPRLFQAKIDFACYSGTAELYADPACVQEAVREFASPDVEAPEKATASALGLKPKPTTAPPPRRTTVLVLNGNGVPGAAGNASFLLARLGYRTLTPPGNARADAPSYDYASTKAYYDPAQPRAQAAATRLARLFGGADVEPMPAEIAPLSRGAMTVVVVGQTFTGELSGGEADPIPPRRPPNVVRNPDLTLPLLRDAQRRVRFPLMVPTVLERNSYLVRDAPIRTYRVAGYRTVRLVFGTGASEYWGIQMIKWRDAPALADPTRKVTIGGRRYDLHYAGSRLRMVVLRENGASYWVVNTLLNSLSNETMLAIARGLRPLNR